MKNISIALISLYQVFFSTILKHVLGQAQFCRYSPTCSEFAKIEIKKHGVVLGSANFLKRLVTCHPFSKIRYSSI